MIPLPGALQAVSVNMAHDIVTHQLFAGSGFLVIDVILVGFQLGNLFIGNVQALLLLSLGQRNPQPAPGANLLSSEKVYCISSEA